MTTIYLMRHSEPLEDDICIKDVNEGKFYSDIKNPLSVYGEHLAEKISQEKEFRNIDVVLSNNSAKEISTAKYFAYKNNLKINITDIFEERVNGINSWDKENPSYLEENKKETTTGLIFSLESLLKEYSNKKILIVGYSTAFTFLLSRFCEINNDNQYKFNGKVFFDGKWNYCETFKLEFDDNNNLFNISNIKYN